MEGAGSLLRQDMASSAEKVKTPQGGLRAIGFGQVGEHGKGIQLL
jgi:hypothetical protein